MTEDISAFIQRLEENPNNKFARFHLGQAYFAKGDYGNALVQFNACVEASEEWMMAHLYLAKAYLGLNQRGDATRHLERTIRLAEEQNHEDPLDEARSLLEECRLY